MYFFLAVHNTPLFEFLSLAADSTRSNGKRNRTVKLNFYNDPMHTFTSLPGFFFFSRSFFSAFDTHLHYLGDVLWKQLY